VLDVRAQVGGRLNTLDAQKNINADVDIQSKSLLSDLQDLDYADALSRLNLQLTGLQASEKAFAQTQGLSLFNYI
jgi:flagellar hook-associated protein 3 FlgL